ncbi:MAG: hypothetical protein N3A71_00905 [Candidatus Dojkabacteria bacterium]|nr:hypothetical protein [Candidatus Dojkabacteria bacterium]
MKYYSIKTAKILDYIIDITKILFSKLKYYVIYLLLISNLFILPHFFFLSKDYWISWEWFHEKLIIPFLWYFPILMAILLYFKEKNQFKFIDRKIEILFYEIIIFVCLSILIGSISQVLGGCIWQLPAILQNWPGYAWKRFGYHLFDDNILIIFYGLSAVLSLIIFIKISNKIKNI